jgi:serine/threonine-protein kinase RsbW/stage II sporulation protein AB (anti-sigma F factor)
VRGQLGDALARHDLAAGRRDDIALVLTEAATNAVWHAYLDTNPGPLYVSARLLERSLIIVVIDRGRGMLPRSDSPGLGLGLQLMARLTDVLRISSDPCGAGTCVQATFERATGAPGCHARMSTATADRDRAEMLREYVEVLTAATASLHQDTRAVLAQAEQAVAHARRQQRERARR